MAAQRAPLPSEDLRKVRFGRFVQRVLDTARSRGMSIKEIEVMGGVGKSTLYRWRDGVFLPRVPELRRFREGMGASISEAYAALGWSEQEPDKPARPTPLVEDPDIRALMRRLTSPHTPAAEKQWIRRQIRALAGQVEDTDD